MALILFIMASLKLQPVSMSTRARTLPMLPINPCFLAFSLIKGYAATTFLVSPLAIGGFLSSDILVSICLPWVLMKNTLQISWEILLIRMLAASCWRLLSQTAAAVGIRPAARSLYTCFSPSSESSSSRRMSSSCILLPSIARLP